MWNTGTGKWLGFRSTMLIEAIPELTSTPPVAFIASWNV